MESLLITVDNPLHVKSLKAFLKTIPYIKSVEETKKLTDSSWILSSRRAATDFKLNF